jgi:Retroviral aspartyl protease
MLRAKPSGKDKPDKLGAMIDQMHDSIDSGIDQDQDYLCSIHNCDNTLMLYHCEANKVRGTALLDTGATKNYISRRYAERANLKFMRMGDSQCSIRLPSGKLMRILGYCEFELKLSEWTGTVIAAILDLDADFDVILGLSWH